MAKGLTAGDTDRLYQQTVRQTMTPLSELMERLRTHHPLVIEGMSGYDPRAPEPVASHIVDRLTAHWHANPYRKPIALISQGDPIEERGISAITRLVSESLSVPRFMIYLDPYIADYHLKDADQYRVELTLPYSALLDHLATIHPNSEALLTERIKRLIDAKNRAREELGKPPLQSYYRDFALLQEVTKAACRSLCGEITIIHTSAVIPPFSVSSFFEVGLDLGLIHPDDMIAFEAG
ncbi:MAG: shikimate kinase [Gammaproteobacteria bacterium]|jgi:hypothetical protein